MELSVAGVVLLSAALHPIRDLLIKGGAHREGIYLAIILSWIVLSAVHAGARGFELGSALAVWPLVLISAAGLLLYGIALVETLGRGELSVYYPIIRASPLFVVVVGFLFLGHRYGGLMLGGIGCVLIGGFFLQWRPGRRLLDDPKALAAALLAMAGTGIYSLADARSVQAIEPPVLFFWVNLALVPFYAVFVFLRRPSGGRFGAYLVHAWRTQPWRFSGAALTSYASGMLVLTAYQMGGDVAAVTSLRQASIPLSVVFAGLFLAEKGLAPRLLWSGLIAAGIVVIIEAG